MEILFKKAFDIDEVISKIKYEIKKLEVITDDNISTIQKDIFKNNKLYPLGFDVENAEIKFNKDKPVEENFLIASEVDYAGDLFFGTIYLSTDLIKGTRSLLFVKPVDFVVNESIKGYAKETKLYAELQTSIYDVKLLSKEDKDKFTIQKKVLKEYLVEGMYNINNEIPDKNIEIEEKILELLNKKKDELKVENDLKEFLNG
ncbi:hypothetical protein [Flavobacterium sp.]|uniref:hypothetical protein n=1 Tax=Flavobacterium sp. TaxID=239 RepID=UPI00286DBC7A|nr:hypothetical protein [Flavobacterium sp.]